MSDVAFDWTYAPHRPALSVLRRSALARQWDPDTDLSWTAVAELDWPLQQFPLAGAQLYEALDRDERRRIRREFFGYMVSQLLHGEQGALVASARLVAQAPHLDSKSFASSQVGDEARHTQAFERYLRHSGAPRYPVAQELQQLLMWIVSDSRWDLQVLGMNVIIEGLAMATLATMQRTIHDPLLVDICRLVLRDEARHVAFSGHALRDHLQGLSEAELRERTDFVFEAVRLMHKRLLFQEVWQRVGLPVDRCKERVERDQSQLRSRQILFANIVRTLGKVGLLSPQLRQRLAGLGVLTARTSSTALAMGAAP